MRASERTGRRRRAQREPRQRTALGVEVETGNERRKRNPRGSFRIGILTVRHGGEHGEFGFLSRRIRIIDGRDGIGTEHQWLEVLPRPISVGARAHRATSALGVTTAM